MKFAHVFLAANAAVLSLADDATSPPPAGGPQVPSLKVPACPAKGTVQYDKTVPNKTAFPPTRVDACYDTQAIRLVFTAYNETNYFYNASYTTNSPIYQYEVMETFIYHGTNDPQTYLEFEVAPNNVTFNAFIYNPSKRQAPGAVFDGAFLISPINDGLTATTKLDRQAHTWTSSVRIPLGLFNVDDGKAAGTRWRMNFLRTVTSPSMFPKQILGAWSPPDVADFHVTSYFGHVEFV